MTEIEVSQEDPTPSTMLQEMRNMMSSMKEMCANVQVLPEKSIEPEEKNSNQHSGTSDQFGESLPTVNCPAFNFLSGNVSCGPAECAKTQHEIVSSPFTAGVTLAKSVSSDLKSKIVSNKSVELGSLIDSKQIDTVYALKNQATDEGFLPVWSPLQPKSKPLSLLQAFLKYGSVFAEAHPDKVQHIFSYMYKILDLASCKGDWQYYDREFRKDKVDCGYSFSGRRVDLYTKALAKGGDFTGQDRGKVYTNQPFRVPKGYCYAYHDKNSRCTNSPCRYEHNCYRCESSKAHPSFMCRKVQ